MLCNMHIRVECEAAEQLTRGVMDTQFDVPPFMSGETLIPGSDLAMRGKPFFHEKIPVRLVIVFRKAGCCGPPYIRSGYVT
jgi:hypothetical protein